MQLPDYPQVEQVRRRLWTGREVGRAAVMVGAGFSRNADPLRPSAPPFPLWNTLAERFYDALNPEPQPDRALRIARAVANGGALRLASEYQIAFGRQSLDELVSKSVPDDSHAPGELHRALLALPWADVFTTNYDTLLERASRDVPERKYELALTLADLPHATKPRIVKLHGSLPSHRPLVLTEEDYRTYPRRFAPFVNTVQQSLMENAFVLLGFSGDDPNFLEWTGWVRDNLGTSHPPIYLCGVLDLAPSARRFLEARGIAPIDLAPIFPTDEYPSPSERHRKALQWLLLTLAAGAPADVIAWPRPIERAAPAVEALPPVPPGPKGLAPENPFPSDDYHRGSISEPAQEEDMPALRNLWRRKREAYPGWVLLPQRNHHTLWHYTSRWIDLAAVRAAGMAPVEALALTHELVWRLDRLTLPLPSSVAERVVALLEAVSPFPEHHNASRGEVNPKSPDHAGLPWERIRTEWVDLAFALIRHARESGDAGQWEAWIDALRPIVPGQPDWSARWHHERCVRALYRSDVPGVEAALAEWMGCDVPPFWKLRRAAILAEVGRIPDASREAANALAETRARQRGEGPDLTSLSEEGCAILLLDVLRIARSLRLHPEASAHGGRLEVLERTRCNPDFELEAALQHLDGPVPVPPERHFWPEEGRRRVRALSSELETHVPAFRLLRFADEGGCPFRVGRVVYKQKQAIAAAKWIAPLYPGWANDIVLRFGDASQAKRWFDPVRVAGMSPEVTDDTVSRLHLGLVAVARHLASLATSRSTAEGEFRSRRFQVLATALGHVAFRLGSEQLGSLLQTAMELYRAEAVRDDPALYDPLRALFRGVLGAAPPEVLRTHMRELAELPIPNAAGFQVREVELFPEPFRYLTPEEPDPREPAAAESLTPYVATLNALVGAGEPADARSRSTLRLWFLDLSGYLTPGERTAFGAALWAHVADDTGFPLGTSLLPRAFLGLPAPDPAMPLARVREHLAALPAPRITASGTYTVGDPIAMALTSHVAQDFAHAWTGVTRDSDPARRQPAASVDWTSRDVSELLDRIVSWWRAESDLLRADDTYDPGGTLRSVAVSNFLALVPVLRVVVLPNLNAGDQASIAEAGDLLEDMASTGLDVLETFPELLRHRPDLAESVAHRMRRTLSRGEEGSVSDAAAGIYYWAIGGMKERLPEVPPDLVDELVSRVAARRGVDYSDVLGHLCDLLVHTPTLISETQADELLKTLEYLSGEMRVPTEVERARERTVQILGSAEDPFVDLPIRRAAVARLAGILWHRVGGAAADTIPEVLREWRDAAISDPFPVVRSAWKRGANE